MATKNRKGQTIVLASGGTGGHLFPACALAGLLLDSGYDVLVLTDVRGGRFIGKFKRTIPYKIISSDTIRPGLTGKIKSAWRIGVGVLQSLSVLLSTRAKSVVAFGGYPCFPPSVAGVILRKPVILQEQNALMGRANRALARFADKIASAFKNTAGISDNLKQKIIHTGNPLRPEVVDRTKLFSYEPPKPDRPVKILVVGGSQGSSIFSTVIPEAITLLPEGMRRAITLVQQVREEDLNTVQKHYDALNFDVSPILTPFIDNMADVLSQTHLVISRAGASIISELTALGIPAIYVPLAASLDGDQAENAKEIVTENGGWILPESDFTPEKLASLLQDCLSDYAQLYKTAQNCRKLGNPNATENLMALVEQTIRK